MNAVAGDSYYVTFAFVSTKAWAFPLAGTPYNVRMISKDEADALLHARDHSDDTPAK